MELIIKGMGMPANCLECRFSHDGRCLAMDCELEENEVGEIGGTKPGWCPLYNEIVFCKDCANSTSNGWVCKKWGNGCMTNPYGYCHLREERKDAREIFTPKVIPMKEDGWE